MACRQGAYGGEKGCVATGHALKADGWDVKFGSSDWCNVG